MLESEVSVETSIAIANMSMNMFCRSRAVL